MAIPEEPPLSPWTSTTNSPVFELVIDKPGKEPSGQKVDPSTIQWPEGVPKPWEKPKDGPQKPSSEE